MYSQHVAFIKSMELDEHVNRASPHGEVVADSIAAFTSNVSGQQLLDVQNSTLFAQLAADKKYPKGEQVKDWYDFYVQVLGKLGWVKQDFHFTKYKSQQASFKLSEVTLELLRALIGGSEELLSVVKATLDNLAKSQDGLILFSKNSTSSNNGRFQILPCTVTNDQVSLSFLAAYFDASQVSYDFFFTSYKSQDIQLHTATQTFTLNEEHYAHVRQTVIDKLGKSARQFIFDLDI